MHEFQTERYIIWFYHATHTALSILDALPLPLQRVYYTMMANLQKNYKTIANCYAQNRLANLR